MIHAENLGYSYDGRQRALQGLDLDIHPGERLAIIGPNGSGKSTLARCLSGLCQPSSGRVLIDDLCTSESANTSSVRRRVGMVFQNPNDQLLTTSVEAEIAFGLENICLPSCEMPSRVTEMLQAFDLEGLRHHPPHQLSGGEKQLLAIAAAVALAPRYLILDEPTSLLDPLHRREVRRAFVRLQDHYKMATVHITQEPAEAAHAQRVIVMHQGKIFADGKPDIVFARADALRAIGLGLSFSQDLSARLRQIRSWDLPASSDIEQLAQKVAEKLTPYATAPPNQMVCPSNQNILAIENLSYTYDAGLPIAHKALDDVNVAFPTGRITALLGPSGSGKTTLAQHCNALLKANDGRILLEGKDISTLKSIDVCRRVGLVFQFPELQLFEETVAADLSFGPRNLGHEPKTIAKLCRRAMADVGLDWAQFEQRPPLELSGGEKRRVALAGVLSMDPQVLILDEPTAGLEPEARSALAGIFVRLARRGTTVVLITHDLDLVAGIAHFAVILNNGRVQRVGTTRELFGHTDFEIVSGLVPPSAVRFMRCLKRLGHAVPTDLLTPQEICDYLTEVRQPRDSSRTL